MKKKFLFRKILLLLTWTHFVSAMQNNHVFFNQIFLRYFSEKFENDIANETPLILHLNISHFVNNKQAYFKEKFFLDRFQLCFKLMLLSRAMHNCYSKTIIKKYEKDFLVLSFILRQIHPLFKEQNNENIYFNYKKINCTIIDDIWKNILNQNKLSRIQVQRRFYALLETYGPDWDKTGFEAIQHMANINRSLQTNILSEIVGTGSFLLKKDLKDAFQGSVGRFEPKGFSSFLERNNVSLIFTSPETNEQVDCKEILENAKLKKKIHFLLNDLPDDHKFFFINKQENQKTLHILTEQE
jgi:hypothetical protein